jgi:coenzyme F420-reducing hydrogenase alpha subunit
MRHLPSRLSDGRVRGARGRLRRHRPGAIGDLRRLLYCGEWIESHALHIYLLHAPDFLGFGGGIEMATDRRDLVDRGLA